MVQRESTWRLENVAGVSDFGDGLGEGGMCSGTGC